MQFVSTCYCILSIMTCRFKRTIAMRRTRTHERSAGLRRLRWFRRRDASSADAIAYRSAGFLQEKSGVAAVEFALVAPLLLTISLAGIIFALALNNYVIVTNAAAVGVSNLILSRGGSTPYTDTVTAVRQAAQSLAQASLTIVMSVDGATCADDASCTTALNSAGGKQANVAVSYPCRLVVLNVDFAPGGCSLSQSTAGRIQ